MSKTSGNYDKILYFGYFDMDELMCYDIAVGKKNRQMKNKQAK